MGCSLSGPRTEKCHCSSLQKIICNWGIYQLKLILLQAKRPLLSNYAVVKNGNKGKSLTLISPFAGLVASSSLIPAHPGTAVAPPCWQHSAARSSSTGTAAMGWEALHAPYPRAGKEKRCQQLVLQRPTSVVVLMQSVLWSKVNSEEKTPCGPFSFCTY